MTDNRGHENRRQTHQIPDRIRRYLPDPLQGVQPDSPSHLEGRSMMPLLDDPQRPWKKAVSSQYPRGRVMGYTMRTERFRYTEWRDRKTNKLMARELYDHEKDPQENINAVDQPEYESDIQKLAGMLKRGWRAARHVD